MTPIFLIKFYINALLQANNIKVLQIHKLSYFCFTILEEDVREVTNS